MRILAAVLLLVILLPAATWAADCTGAQPNLCLSLNQTTFQAGQALSLSATVTPGGTPAQVDVYVALQLPTGALLFLQGNGTFTTSLTPLVSGWALTAYSGQVFGYTFGGGEPGGTYHWLAAFTQPGTLNFLGAIADTPFQFNPPTPSLSGIYDLTGGLTLTGCGLVDGSYPLTGDLTLQQDGTSLTGSGHVSMPTAGLSATLQLTGTVNGTTLSGSITATTSFGPLTTLFSGIAGINTVTNDVSGTILGTTCHYDFSWTGTRR